jgi:Zn-dependent peptidase ImmA (M78 family)
MATALLLEKVLGIDARFWINRESLYREKLARIEEAKQYEGWISWVKVLPHKLLRKLGYLKAETESPALVAELLQFFGVGSPNQWEKVYGNQYANTSFRKTEAFETSLGAIATWLRIGEIEKQKMELPDFDKEKFKSVLQEALVMVRKHPEDFAVRLRSLCQEAGVALVYTVQIQKAPASGAVRWVGGHPLLQLTDRYKTNDHFWFNFFHEAGHILLHGKKDVFYEDMPGYELDEKKESEANIFAANQLLPESFIDDLPSKKLKEQDIRDIARDYKTHPAIVVGRLQTLKRIEPSFFNQLKMRVDLEQYITPHKTMSM